MANGFYLELWDLLMLGRFHTSFIRFGVALSLGANSSPLNTGIVLLAWAKHCEFDASRSGE